jgi:putative transposase
MLKKAGCALHAYCLMTNHVHLLVTPADQKGCSTLMRDLGQRYVQYFNKRYGRSGTLWEARFRSCLVDSASYVLACYRYIELNPVRAGMVPAPDRYRWSSYRGNVGEVENKVLTPHIEYLALSDDPDRRRAAYRQFFEAEGDATFVEAVRNATNGGYPLVGERLKSMLSITSSRRLEPGKPGRKRNPSDEREPTTEELGL